MSRCHVEVTASIEPDHHHAPMTAATSVGIPTSLGLRAALGVAMDVSVERLMLATFAGRSYKRCDVGSDDPISRNVILMVPSLPPSTSFLSKQWLFLVCLHLPACNAVFKAPQHPQLWVGHRPLQGAVSGHQKFEENLNQLWTV